MQHTKIHGTHCQCKKSIKTPHAAHSALRAPCKYLSTNILETIDQHQYLKHFGNALAELANKT
jgi:hypothetical protein